VVESVVVVVVVVDSEIVVVVVVVSFVHATNAKPIKIEMNNNKYFFM
jgi:hypothetical protein